MSTLKLTSRFSNFLAIEASSPSFGWGNRVCFAAATRPLQAKKDKEAADKTIEQAEAVKEGAKEVRKTCEFIRDTGSSMVKMTKEATEKVSEAAEAITEKTKDTVSGAWGTAKNTTDIIKDKIVGK